MEEVSQRTNIVCQLQLLNIVAKTRIYCNTWYNKVALLQALLLTVLSPNGSNILVVTPALNTIVTHQISVFSSQGIKCDTIWRFWALSRDFLLRLLPRRSCIKLFIVHSIKEDQRTGRKALSMSKVL